MTKAIVVLAGVLMTVASHGQGFIHFSTRVAGGIDAPITYLDGTGPGPSFSAALYLVHVSGTETLLPDSITTFRSGAGAAYIVSKIVKVPVVPAGTPATFRIRAWETSAGDYFNAWNHGESIPFTVIPTEPPDLPADLPASVPGFLIGVPEPSTICLLAAGAAVLLMWRRRRD